jgi:intracellular sulfur oxidation DsrE/DsrF family protein
MKSILLCLAMLVSVQAWSQDENYKVVFDMTSKDSVNQQTLVRQMNIIRELNPHSQLEVVVYGMGLNLVLKDGSSQQDAVARLLEDKNISFKVCAVTLQRMNVDRSRLLPGVQVVPDGIYEIISKQREGWGYIKVAH